MRRLYLIRHAPTKATHAAAFPLDEPLTEAGHDGAAALAARLPRHDEALCSPALRCRQTAHVAGLNPAPETALAECDFGAWGGRTLAELVEADPESTRAWMTDPDAAPHGGESLRAFAHRIGNWLGTQAAHDGRAIAVTHGGVVRGAVVHALGAPLDAFWRVDAAPLSITELHAHDGRWTVTCVNNVGPTDACRARGAFRAEADTVVSAEAST